MKTVLSIAGSLVLAASLSYAQAPTGCGQTVVNDARAVAADLQAIAAQAKAQGFQTAAEQLAKDLEEILPTLTKPSRDAVEKFVSDLEEATSPASPGGSGITAAERLKLANDWAAIVSSTGITSDQIATITNDVLNALSTLEGISTAQLHADLTKLRTDAAACRAAN